MATGVAFIAGEYVNVDEAKISIFGLGFSRSDVAYDAVSTWKHSFFRIHDHIDRISTPVLARVSPVRTSKRKLKRAWLSVRTEPDWKMIMWRC